ncbi:ABC transporter substrate-binding protein [Pleurocapsa sp. PCC 7319]|uniref:ABC transporter substrate-binding protein n=1 Tax=Pleurocapsa sp. PCC 7319 TaxID=118161 RepID=UPI00034B50E3|nr:ABC transporter substrate-binding protein [Pleurocapsa sp. PCC 7319]
MGSNFRLRFKVRYWSLVIAIAIIFISIACSNFLQNNSSVTTKSAQETTELNIWWEQGFNLEEDEALRTVVNNWQEQTGNKAKLSFFTLDELTAKVERAVKVGHTPDIMMNLKAERILYPRLAWQGELEDVADIIEPIKDAYSDNTLRAITYYNASENKRSYYGVPLDQATMFIYYWQKLLASVSLDSRDIPQDWDGFWQFWLQAQEKLKTEQNQEIFGLGLTLSDNKSTNDTHNLFEQVLEAYDVDLFNEQEKLDLDNPKVRQGIIDCLNWYVQLYKLGCIPPDAAKWSNIDNNRNLLNKLVLMTPNNTLSIPATVRQDPETYYNQLGILEFPHKPSGEPMRYLIFVRQAVIFKNSTHKFLAKDFLRYLIQPEVTISFLKATGNRYQPVQTAILSDPFWQDTSDPYIATATKILTAGHTRLSYIVSHPAYSQVLAENIWGQALTQVTVEQINPEIAADEAIERIREIFEEWR